MKPAMTNVGVGRMKRLLAVLLSAFALAATGAAAAPPLVKIDHGNVVLVRGAERAVLTHSGHDTDAVLSPDGRLVVFTRIGAPSRECADFGGARTRLSLWVIGADGNGARKLAESKAAQKRERNLCAFNRKQFSSDGSRLYFETPAWATSPAVHVVDVRTGRERFFLAGELLRVLAPCGDRRYRDDLVIGQHRYFIFGGSYDWGYLFSPAGKEIGPVAEAGSDLGQIDNTCEVL